MKEHELLLAMVCETENQLPVKAKEHEMAHWELLLAMVVIAQSYCYCGTERGLQR